MSNLNNKRWTKEEDEFAALNIFKITDDELEVKLNRSMNAIRKRLQKLVRDKTIVSNRPYTKYEDDFILENYGTDTAEKIGLSIFRTESSVKYRAAYLMGGSTINIATGDYTVTDLVQILGKSRTSIANMRKKNGLPFDRIGKIYIYHAEEFWEWIEDSNNHWLINAKAIDYDDLYYCPEWYRELVNKLKREANNGLKKGEYSSKEIALGWRMIEQGYTYREIAKELNRPFNNVMIHFGKLKRKKREEGKKIS